MEYGPQPDGTRRDASDEISDLVQLGRVLLAIIFLNSSFEQASPECCLKFAIDYRGTAPLVQEAINVAIRCFTTPDDSNDAPIARIFETDYVKRTPL